MDEKERHTQLIILFYQYFYRKFSGVGSRKPNPKYIFKPTDTGKKVIDSFLNLPNLDSFGPVFYFNYFCFQWNYWANSEKIEVMTINPGSVLDKNAYNRWCKRNREFDYQNKAFCDTIGIKEGEILKIAKELIITPKEEQISLDFGSTEEVHKKVYKNGSEKRLAYCFLTTTLFSRRSKECVFCKSKSDCKELLKVIYPELSSNRLEYAGEIK